MMVLTCLLQQPDVETMETAQTNQPPKQADGVDDVVEPMDTVSLPNQPLKQADGAGDDEITLAFDTLKACSSCRTCV